MRGFAVTLSHGVDQGREFGVRFYISAIDHVPGKIGDGDGRHTRLGGDLKSERRGVGDDEIDRVGLNECQFLIDELLRVGIDGTTDGERCRQLHVQTVGLDDAGIDGLARIMDRRDCVVKNPLRRGGADVNPQLRPDCQQSAHYLLRAHGVAEAVTGYIIEN